MYHFLLLVPVAIGSSASAFFITTVNSFMNSPQGFDWVNGQMTNIQPLAAMFNPSMPTRVSHVLVTAYVTSAFLLAAIAAVSMLRGRSHVYYKKALRLTMTSALIFAVASAAIGDLSGKYLHEYQPEKLAAAEWHFETKDSAELILGGILTKDNEVKFAIKIPFALSILAGGTPDTVVQGLNEVPEHERPPLRATHYFFDSMVFIGIFLTVVSLWYVVWQYRRRKTGKPISRLLLYAIVAGAPLAFLAIESGWMFAEVGRQPWVLWKIMTVEEGATTSEHVDTMLVLFTLLYLVLSVTAVKVLRSMFRNNPAEAELEANGMEGGMKR